MSLHVTIARKASGVSRVSCNMAAAPVMVCKASSVASGPGNPAATPPAINVASMIGHATLREQVMGEDLYRASTPQELARMKVLLAREIQAGAFGLSTGLEYGS